MYDFRKDHKWSFRAFYCFDVILRLIYLSVVLLVAIRGLGLVDFIYKSLKTFNLIQ